MTFWISWFETLLDLAREYEERLAAIEQNASLPD
jgi:hypothetical protein